ncbi:MAG: superoxide dismutase [Caulobacter sp.]|nr:superoxide dismutase [Caulobacter sp.]
MRLLSLTLAAAGLALATGLAFADTPPASANADLKAADGSSAGTVRLTEAPGGVLLKIEVKGLTPGWHGVHFHEKGDCSSADFKSAGGHVHGAAAAVHGLLNPAATEAGDLPNLFVAADGTGAAEMYSPSVSLKGARGRPALLDADGAALVVHASPDDHMTQPIGGAGARVACGVIAAR